MVNDLKNVVSAAIDEKKEKLDQELLNARLKSEKIDISLDGYVPKNGTLHPLTLVQKELEDVFIGMGYNVAEGPEVETDLYNLPVPIHRKAILQETCRILSTSIRHIF